MAVATTVLKYTGPISPAEIRLSNGGKLTVVAGNNYEFDSTVAESLLTGQPHYWTFIEGAEPTKAPPEGQVLTVTSAFSLTRNDRVVYADATAGGFAVTLPSAALFGGVEFTIRAIAANENVVTVPGVEGQTISLGTTQVYAGITVASDGTTWRIV